METALLPREFFCQGPVELATQLIGCELVWHGTAGRIVETEAYASTGDEACHTFTRPSARQFVAQQAPGTAYVYMNYGIHWLFNILAKSPAGPEGLVLIRALEPTAGLEGMRQRRGPGRESPRQLCSGPGKLAQALGIRGLAHGTDLCAAPRRGLRAPAEPIPPQAILADTRIGISKAAHLPWRFLLAGSPCLSVRASSAARPLV